MKQTARTLRSHRELLLNYFRARKAFSSGVIKGPNKKAKVTMTIFMMVKAPNRPKKKLLTEIRDILKSTS